jgi:hypothetical protein
MTVVEINYNVNFNVSSFRLLSKLGINLFIR